MFTSKPSNSSETINWQLNLLLFFGSNAISSISSSPSSFAGSLSIDKLPAKEDGEEDMLDMAFEPKNNSRLSCQLIVSDELDGLEVNIPSKQG